MTKLFLKATIIIATSILAASAGLAQSGGWRYSGGAHNFPQCVAAADRAAPPRSGNSAVRQAAYDACAARIQARQKKDRR